WPFNMENLKKFFPGMSTIEITTAFGLILGGACLWLWRWKLKIKHKKFQATIQFLIFILAFFIVLIAFLTLLQSVFNANLDIDRLLMQQPESPGSTAPNTALAFLLVGFALLLLNVRHPNFLMVQGIALGAWLIAFLGLLSYVYGSIYFYTAGIYTGMAIHTPIALLLLTSGILCARPDRGIMKLLSGDGVGSIMARRLLFVALVVPIFVKGLCNLGYQQSFYSFEMAKALESILDTIAFVSAIGWNAYKLNCTDHHRDQAEQALRASQARFAGILEIASDAIISVDGDRRITLFNQGAEKIFGYTADEILGQSLDLLLPDRFAIAHRQHVSNFGEFASKTRRMAASREIFGRRKDGTEFPAEASISTLKINGEIICTAFLRDITESKQAEEIRRESEERFRSAFDYAAIGMALVGLDGNWLKVNRSLCEITGYSELELLATTFQAITHPEDLEIDLNYMQKLLTGEIRFYQMEKRYFHKQGHIVWILLSGSIVRNTEGEPLYFIAQIKDITDRKIAEAALRQSEERYRGILEDQTELISRFQPDGTLSYINEAYCRFFGKKREELIGKSYAPVIFEEDREKIDRLLSTLNAQNPVVTIENRVIVAGEVRWTQWINRIIFDDRGNFVEFQSVGRDITDRKQAEDALRASEQRFHAIFNLTFQFVGLLSPDGILLEVNQSALDFGGLQRSDVVGRPYWEAQWWAISAATQNELKNAIARAAMGEFVRYEVNLQGAGNTLATIDFSIKPVKDERGKVIMLIAEGRDISDRKQAEELIKASLIEKEVLLREIHHRVKNNMQIIYSLLRMQARRTSDDRIAAILKDSQDRIKSMALVHEKLYRSQDLSEIDLEEYVQSLAASLFSSYGVSGNIVIESKINQFFLDIDTAIPCGLILNELISNSLKYAFPGNAQGKIEVEFYVEENKNNVLIFKDNGIGLPADFDIETATSLGLKLVKRLVSQLDGTIDIDTSNGTQFRIAFAGGKGSCL
ncbi:PAS domain S-box protein, partial [Planktothrix sp. FACHB-1355]